MKLGIKAEIIPGRLLNKKLSSQNQIGHLNRTFSVIHNRERTINILVPTMDGSKIYAGVHMIISLGLVLNKLGVKVRFISTEVSSQEEGLKKYISSHFQDLPIDDIEFIVDHHQNNSIKISKDDVFVATYWKTAYYIQNLIPQLVNKKFIYLIQDFEPCFYPWSSNYFRAYNTYQMDYIPVFSSTYLAEFFIKNGLIEGKNYSYFYPVIEKKLYHPLSESEYSQKKRFKFIMYGRPSIPRNLFEVAIEILTKFIRVERRKKNIDFAKWDFYSCGEKHSSIVLYGDMKLISLGKLSPEKYAEMLRTCDVGLSLMLSPHPSYPPLEMAQSGVVTVTNNYETKNLSELSGNLICVDPNIESGVEGLKTAFLKCHDYKLRIKESELPFPSTVEECFKDASKYVKKCLL
jgi:hypothetical protein